MKIISVRLKNFRSFTDSGIIELDQINVLIGENNSGKSSVIRGLHHLQEGIAEQFSDVRVGEREATIDIELSDFWNGALNINHPTGLATFSTILRSTNRRTGSIDDKLLTNQGRIQGNERFPYTEPNHFIVPYLSQRKTEAYDEEVGEDRISHISPSMRSLTAKLSRVSNIQFPAYEKYAKACREILGFVVTTIPSPLGLQPGIYLPDQSTVSIKQMGDGVPNIVSLLAHLAVSEDKLFLIEEPENDLHPFALKSLLDLILVSSESNQFVISTHSNIVVTHLCSESNSKLFRVTSQKGKLPTETKIECLPPTEEVRISVLQELGYAFSDFGVWDGWLILEESSAERIIRDYLVPWFVPRLARIKTVAAGGVDNVEPVFEDFRRLMLFTHLQPGYAHRAWVRVDGDERGGQIIDKLCNKYQSLNPSHFKTFDQPQFESFYPYVFSERVERVMSIGDKQEKRKEKKFLLKEVMDWLDEDNTRAKTALKESAKMVIQELKDIEKQFCLQKQNY